MVFQSLFRYKIYVNKPGTITVQSLYSKLGRDHYYNERFLLSNGDVKNPWPPLIFFLHCTSVVLFD
jgi:hypothetical protein